MSRLCIAAALLFIASACELSPDAPPEALLDDDAGSAPCDASDTPDARRDTAEPDFGSCAGAGTSCGSGCLGDLPREQCACAGRMVCSGDVTTCVGPSGAPVAQPFLHEEVCDNGVDDDCDGAVDEGCATCP